MLEHMENHIVLQLRKLPDQDRNHLEVFETNKDGRGQMVIPSFFQFIVRSLNKKSSEDLQKCWEESYRELK